MGWMHDGKKKSGCDPTVTGHEIQRIQRQGMTYMSQLWKRKNETRGYTRHDLSTSSRAHPPPSPVLFAQWMSPRQTVPLFWCLWGCFFLLAALPWEWSRMHFCSITSCLFPPSSLAVTLLCPLRLSSSLHLPLCSAASLVLEIVGLHRKHQTPRNNEPQIIFNFKYLMVELPYLTTYFIIIYFRLI